MMLATKPKGENIDTQDLVPQPHPAVFVGGKVTSPSDTAGIKQGQGPNKLYSKIGVPVT